MDATITTGLATGTDDHPGRWIGGLLGALASLSVAGSAALMGSDADFGWLDAEFVVLVGLLGVPIGWILGRAAFPLARDGGWGQALAVGFGLAWVAPPLGGLAWLLFALVEDALGPPACGSSPAEALLLLPFIVPWSYLALVATIPAGLLYGATIRLVPTAVPGEARMPPLIARLGTRHLIAILAIVIGAIIAATSLAGPACP